MGIETDGTLGTRRWRVVLAAVVAVLALIAVWRLTAPASLPDRLAVATGVKDGTWNALGGDLAAMLTDELDGVAVEAVRTAGSVENLRRLEAGEVDLAFVQNDTPGGKNIRTIASLYDDVVHLVIPLASRGPVRNVRDLRGKRVAIGARGSGTAVVAVAVLEHFGLAAEQRYLDTRASLAALDAGEVDAAFILSALPSPTIAAFLEQEKGVLLELGEVDRVGAAVEGVLLSHPWFDAAIIPKHTYGQLPEEAAGTISVRTLLVARDDFDAELARRVTRALFANKVRLADSHVVAARLDESFSRTKLRFPMHEGASAWYRREDPSFFVEYAEALSFGFTLLIGVASSLLAFRQWMRHRKKNRVDVYYVEIERIADRIQEATLDELDTLHRQLEDVRRRAFRDLVDERLLADESFRIFQTLLQGEVDAIRDQRRELMQADQKPG